MYKEKINHMLFIYMGHNHVKEMYIFGCLGIVEIWGGGGGGVIQ